MANATISAITVEQTVAPRPTTNEFSVARRRSSFSSAEVYQCALKPPQTVTRFPALKEKKITTAIGAYRKTRPSQAAGAMPGSFVSFAMLHQLLHAAAAPRHDHQAE